MAAFRSRRLAAGNRLAILLEEEESRVEEFYETAYGGFKDEENDDEYKALEDAEDIVDSDFSNADEEDEQISDHEEEVKKQRRKLVKYKEPIQRQPKSPRSSDGSKLKVVHERKPVKCEAKIERMSKRTSTAAKTAATKERIKLRKIRKRPYRHDVGERILTQEELLAEAKETEIENLKSLEKFQKSENERKAKRTVKKVLTCPMIRYLSSRMPVIELSSTTEPVKFQERTFLSFLNDPSDRHFERTFEPFSQKRKVKNEICPITGLPALYFDPVTSLPYRNIFAYRIIREAYYQQLEARGDRENEEVLKWLQWRLSSKEKCREIAKIMLELCKQQHQN